MQIAAALRAAAQTEFGAHWTLAFSFLLIGVIAVADSLTGYEIRLAILYLVPIAWTTWRLGETAGAIAAVVATISWIATFETSHPYSSPAYFYLEGALTAATFMIIVVLLARLHRALERSDQRFLMVLESLDAAVVVHERRSGDVLYENAVYRRVFGRTHAFAQDNGEVYDGATKCWYLLRSRPLRWTDGRQAVLRVLSDMTDVRRARELVARHREAAHQTERLVALGEFASAIAHELNQPLAAIATYNNASLMLLARAPDAPAEVCDAMEKCRDQARRASAIIQRLREMLRHPLPAAAREDLNDIARCALRLAESEALEARVTVEAALAPELPEVRTDRLLLEQVALNLVRNAIQAVEHLPAERRRVRIATAPAGERGIELSVSDRGDGLHPGVRERLFQPFVTTKATGLGLGLSICRSVVESLGGTIRWEAAATQGTRFAFTIPLRR